MAAATLSEDVKQRQALIPKIAKALSIWNDLTAHKRTTSTDNLSPNHDNSNCLQGHVQDTTSAEWIEQKLWLSMTRALGIGTGMDVAASSAGVLSTCSKTWNEITGTPDCDDLPLEVTSSDSGRPPPTEVAAERNSAQHESKPFGLPHHHQSLGCREGVSNKLSDRVDSTTMHASAAFLTHVDQNGKIRRLIDARQNIIGQGGLIQYYSRPTPSHRQHDYPDPDFLESIFIYDDAPPPPSLSSRRVSSIEASETDTNLFPFIDNISTPTPISTIPGERSINEMDSTNSSQSLKEVLGDDMLLWSMWKRRPSTYPPGEDDAELLHNMFQNDPDMKLFSPSREDDMSFADIMMLDSYDFSRKSTNSSTSTTPDSYSSSAFEQLEQMSSYSYSSPVQSTSRNTSSTHETKEQRRKSSVPRKGSCPARIPEDDFLFQPMSPTRKVDTKTRKSIRDYSGR